MHPRRSALIALLASAGLTESLCGDRHLVAFADATLDVLPHDRAAAYFGEQTGLSLYGAAVSCPGG